MKDLLKLMDGHGQAVCVSGFCCIGKDVMTTLSSAMSESVLSSRSLLGRALPPC